MRKYYKNSGLEIKISVCAFSMTVVRKQSFFLLAFFKAEADVDQFMLEGHKFPRFAKVCLKNSPVLSPEHTHLH